ncbi:MAG: hypothetical protein ABIW76_12865 [Fibrobacteria bacterium]
MAFVGILFGRMKGRPGWGFLLGLFFGPLGLALMLLMPARVVRPVGKRGAGGAGFGYRNPGDGPGSQSVSGQACPRCGKAVGRSDKACSHCGNVLVPIRYEVRGPEDA